MICGGTVVGYLSQHWGRRRVIILSAIFGMLLIPLWIFAPGTACWLSGGILDSIHGARRLGGGAGTLKRTFAAGFSRDIFRDWLTNWGISPPPMPRSSRPGWQRISSGPNENPNYALTMALVQCFVFLAIILLAAIGPEKHGREF